MIKNMGFSGKVWALIPFTCAAVEQLCQVSSSAITYEIGMNPFRTV